MARCGPDSTEWLPAATRIPRLRCGASVRGARSCYARIERVYQRTNLARLEETTSVPSFWQGMCSTDSSRRHHGLGGRRLRCLLRVRPSSGDDRYIKDTARACRIVRGAHEHLSPRGDDFLLTALA